MNTVAIVIIAVLFVVYIVYLVFFSRDRGQRGRAFQKLAEYFDGTYEIEPSRELRDRLKSLGPARVMTARHHIHVPGEGDGFDIVDLRYVVMMSGRNRIGTSTVGRFDCSGPAFRSIEENGQRNTTGDSQDAVDEQFVPRLAALASELGDAIVEGDGEQVLVYRWRNRVQPHQLPAFKEFIETVRHALTRPL